MDTLQKLVTGICFLGWAVALVSWLDLVLAYPLPQHAFLWYVWHGMASYSASNFDPSGAFVHRVFLAGFAVFMGGLLARIGVLTVSMRKAKA